MWKKIMKIKEGNNEEKWENTKTDERSAEMKKMKTMKTMKKRMKNKTRAAMKDNPKTKLIFKLST